MLKLAVMLYLVLLTPIGGRGIEGPHSFSGNGRKVSKGAIPGTAWKCTLLVHFQKISALLALLSQKSEE
jgi:hypothetical protein